MKNLHPVHKEFLTLLSAAAPTMEAMSNWVNYLNDKDDIMEYDFAQDIEIADHIMQISAKTKGITLEQHKRNLAEDMREDELEKLAKKYGFQLEDDDEEDDERTKLMKHYNKVSDMLTKADDRIKSVDSLMISRDDYKKQQEQMESVIQNEVNG